MKGKKWCKWHSLVFRRLLQRRKHFLFMPTVNRMRSNEIDYTARANVRHYEKLPNNEREAEAHAWMGVCGVSILSDIWEQLHELLVSTAGITVPASTGHFQLCFYTPPEQMHWAVICALWNLFRHSKDSSVHISKKDGQQKGTIALTRGKKKKKKKILTYWNALKPEKMK